MNNSNSINTPLHIVNFVASQSNFAYATKLLFRGSVNYTRYRCTFAAMRAEGMNICYKNSSRQSYISQETWGHVKAVYSNASDDTYAPSGACFSYRKVRIVPNLRFPKFTKAFTKIRNCVSRSSS